MKAPLISFSVTRSLNRIIAGGMIKTGTMAIIVDATPVVVYLMANNENDTPRNGPKKAPIEIRTIAAP